MPEELLTPEEQAGLLRLARRSLEISLQRHGPVRQDEAEKILRPTGHLLSPRGAFVSLHDRAGNLRGCIGHLAPSLPLHLTVVDCAFAAAVRDPRFDPLKKEDLGRHVLEISVLTPPKPILPEEVEVGRHGLIVSHGSRSGLLLPQVATEYGWDRETFLSMTCRKAGLPEDAWRKGAEILAFEAQVFREENPAEPMGGDPA